MQPRAIQSLKLSCTKGAPEKEFPFFDTPFFPTCNPVIGPPELICCTRSLDIPGPVHLYIRLMINRTVSVLYIVSIALTSILFYGCACLIWCLTKPFDKRLVMLHQFTSFWATLYIWTSRKPRNWPENELLPMWTNTAPRMNRVVEDRW
jgi:hypothetical protein